MVLLDQQRRESRYTTESEWISSDPARDGLASDHHARISGLAERRSLTILRLKFYNEIAAIDAALPVLQSIFRFIFNDLIIYIYPEMYPANIEADDEIISPPTALYSGNATETTSPITRADTIVAPVRII